MIKMERVTKIYNEKIDSAKALDNVSIEIPDGALLAIMGPSGSGKSTLLNIIGCMDRVTDGAYYVNDICVSGLNQNKLNQFRKNHIGFVFQHFALMDYYTAYENIELPLLAQNVKRPVRRTRISEVMESLGIGNLRNKKPSEMSGGQQQRVAIARALVTGCDILLADEPTGALDQATGQEVIQLLKEVNRKKTTVIVVTHDEGVASQMDWTVRICDGKVDYIEKNQ